MLSVSGIPARCSTGIGKPRRTVRRREAPCLNRTHPRHAGHMQPPPRGGSVYAAFLWQYSPSLPPVTPGSAFPYFPPSPCLQLPRCSRSSAFRPTDRRFSAPRNSDRERPDPAPRRNPAGQGDNHRRHSSRTPPEPMPDRSRPLPAAKIASANRIYVRKAEELPRASAQSEVQAPRVPSGSPSRPTIEKPAANPTGFPAFFSVSSCFFRQYVLK